MTNVSGEGEEEDEEAPARYSLGGGIDGFFEGCCVFTLQDDTHARDLK